MIGGWAWYPVTAAEVLADIRRGVDDRVNRRGGLPVRDAWTPDKCRRRYVERAVRTGVKSACKWCGGLMPYRPEHMRFCDPGCRTAYHG